MASSLNNNSASPWITKLAAGHERLRLFCFPYAGGGTHIFSGWRGSLPTHVGLYSVQLPGRGRRFHETAFDRLEPMVTGIVEALSAFADLPFVFFGHSMGALVAFETARALRQSGRAGPSWLLASAYRAPQLPRDDTGIHQLPRDAFVAKLQEYAGTPPEVLQNEEILQLMLPVVRADFAVVETYTYEPQPPLSCSITAFGGLQDSHFGRDHVAAWRDQTSSKFDLHMFEGGHFFIHSSQDALLRQIADRLEHLPV